MSNPITKYLAAIGRRGGKAIGGAKAKAARANGRLGGRPKKPSAPTTAQQPARTQTS